jgi:hypothetical protein
MSPGTNWIGGWVDPKDGTDFVGEEKKSFTPAENYTLSVLTVTSRCTDSAMVYSVYFCEELII